jgi:hypothetical protein
MLEGFQSLGTTKVVERTQLNAILSQLRENVKLHPEKYAGDFGKLLGVRYVAVGRIISGDSYTIENVTTFSYASTFQILDTETNEVLLQRTCAPDHTSLKSELSDEVKDWIEDDVSKLFPLQAIPVKVLQADKDGSPEVLLLNQGAAGGIKKGQDLFMFLKEQTREFIKYSPVATLEVTMVEGDDFSEVEVGGRKRDIIVGNIIPDQERNPYVVQSNEEFSSRGNLPKLVISFENTAQVRDAWVLPLAQACLQSGLLNAGFCTILDRSLLKTILQEQNFNLSGLTSHESTVEAGKVGAARTLLKIQLLDVRFIIPEKQSSFECFARINVQLVDMETGSVLLSESIDASTPFFNLRSRRTKPQSFIVTLNVLAEKLSKVLLTNLGLTGKIFEAVSTNSTGEVESALMSIGKARGVKSGMRGVVLAKTKFAGKEIEKEIGEFKVKECESPDFCLIAIDFKGDFTARSANELLGMNSKYSFRIKE